MISSGEFIEIQIALTQLVALNGRNYFQTVFAGPEFMIALDKLAGLAASDEQIAAGAIHVCVRREWMDDPCWLVRLLKGMKIQGGVGGVNPVTNIDAIVERLEQKINVLDEVWYSQWVENGLPFVDRTPLRDTLKEFSRSGGRAVLRIEGDPDTGKSYSRQLLEHVSASEGWSFRIIHVEIEEGAQFAVDAMTLAQTIVGEMGCSNKLTDSGLQDLTVPSIPLLQTWILRCARERPDKRWWFFLDGFRSLPESNTARTLIDGLADKIANGSYRENLRLILVDYDKPLSRVEEEKIAVDRSDTPLSSPVAEQAVYDCLDRLYRQLGRTPAQNELETKTKALLTDLSPDQPWIVAINKRLRAAAKAIRNGK